MGKVHRVVPLFGSAKTVLKKYLNFLNKDTINNFFLFPSGSKDGHITRHRFFSTYKEISR